MCDEREPREHNVKRCEQICFTRRHLTEHHAAFRAVDVDDDAGTTLAATSMPR